MAGEKASKPAGARKRRTGPSVDAMDKYGIARVCESIMDGRSLRTIAEDAGASMTRLLAWIDADPDRSARVREARTTMAKVWDEKAEQAIEDAPDEFGLRKAKELAHHYRWRAAKVAPREYGDKVALEHAGPDGGPIQTEDVTQRDADEFASRMARLAAAGDAGSGTGEAVGESTG